MLPRRPLAQLVPMAAVLAGVAALLVARLADGGKVRGREIALDCWSACLFSRCLLVLADGSFTGPDVSASAQQLLLQFVARQTMGLGNCRQNPSQRS